MLRIFFVFLGLFLVLPLQSAPRYSDPDGCMSCHIVEGLTFIDEHGVTRSSTIQRSHYYSSLHGSVPCKDCLRKIVDYPHKVENGYVDCTESCHVEEPSEGEPYTHKPIFEEMEKSVHKGGWYKDLAGGNRLEEIETEQDPSCRRCHSNTLYILESQLQNFKEAFDHAETECGTCHQGKAWMGQFGGHILRRFIGSRWAKTEGNKFCTDCHGDIEKMRDVELEEPETEEKHPPSDRFIHAVESYDKTLHGRLLVAGSEYGASCLDCHAPSGWKHDIGHYKDKTSAIHIDELKNTCGQSDCHGYAKKAGNEGFVATDMHDVSMLNLGEFKEPWKHELLTGSAWFWGVAPFMVAVIILVLGSLIWLIFFKHNKKIIAILGGSRFERVMIGRKPKKARAARKPAARKVPPAKTMPSAEASKPTFKQEPRSTSTKSEASATQAEPTSKPIEKGEDKQGDQND
jgi:sulfite reductase (NADPH) flavoprotein alpha-component